jgi:phage baseplate assembly protein W
MGNRYIDLSDLIAPVDGVTYRDINPEFKPSVTGTGFEDIINEEDVRNGIKNIFMFRVGDRKILPEFGNRLYTYLYESVSDHVAADIGNEVVNMIEKWESRVEILNVAVTPVIKAQQYIIEVIYTIPTISTTNTYTLKHTLSTA